ncbi:hypothetical protein BU23DRAFT_552780 [Bimuria novae-zelandiae CBS 107.79]|uniref:Uncharacterized protein n=1 Tax=Bimuria novae-zelandiae CBS 107.79 TaxID=1447943 RepID=A0A6A5VEY3_9PLEO|nr:hypothetical protein BU23DRAFT_552780 [Bimuria novae-zelandiae CBS 107.79]
MDSKPAKASTIEMLPSRLQQLPRELRERVYLYLGIPVTGYCIHECNNSCSAELDWRVSYVVDSPGDTWILCDLDSIEATNASETFSATPKILTVKSICPPKRYSTL